VVVRRHHLVAVHEARELGADRARDVRHGVVSVPEHVREALAGRLGDDDLDALRADAVVAPEALAILRDADAIARDERAVRSGDVVVVE
jgi:hypothetical protein